MNRKSGMALLAGMLLCAAAADAFAQGVGAGTTRPGINARPVPGMPTRPNIPGSPGTSLDPGQTGMTTRPLIPGTPGTSFGADANRGVARPDCLNGSITVAGC